MIRKVLLGIVALSALASAVGVALVAAAFALYAAMEPQVGRPGAAAVVAAVAAVIVGLAALFVALQAKGGVTHRSEPEPSVADRIFQVARERPIVAAAGALAAGLLALKNPKAAAGLVSAFLAGRAADRADNRRR